MAPEKQEEAEEIHYRMNKGVFLSEIHGKNGARFVFSDTIEDFFWNYAGLIDTDSPEELLEEIIKFYSKRDRSPAAYITSGTAPPDFEERLMENGFTCETHDTWMFYRGEETGSCDIRMEEVRTDEDAAKFVKLFGNVYGGVEEDEAYGELPEYYRKAVEDFLGRDFDSKDVKNFIAYRDGEPVGIGTVILMEGFAGIYNVGVIPGQRGEGFGSQIVNFLVQEALEGGAEEIFLQTEKGSKNEDFFRKNGFETEFEGKIMVKADE